MANYYFMQIHGSNLADYINKAIILPTKYIQNRTEEDIQSKNEKFILLSNGQFKDLTDNQILLRIDLTDEEVNKLESLSTGSKDVSKQVYLYSEPLPITRVTKIYFENKEKIEHYQSIFSIGDIGYLPSDRLKVLPKNMKKLNSHSIVTKLENLKSNSYQEKLLKYDKIMGMFAFIKNTNLYFTDRDKKASTYSNNYFNFLALLNQSVEPNDNGKISILETLLQFKNSHPLIEKLYTDEKIDEDFIKELAENSKNKDILYKLFDEMEKIEALASLKEEKEFYPAYLYANRFDGDMESLKAKIVDIEDIGKAEILLAMFGLYYGYSKIRAKEEIKIKDDIFKNLLINKREKNIKFMLDSQLDYVTIESIYQYVFNDKISDKVFNYLEYPKYISIIKNINCKSKSKNFKNWYICEHNEYIDVPLINLSKNNWETVINNKLEKYEEQITPLDANLYKFLYVNKVIKETLCENKTVIESHIYKTEIEEYLLSIDNDKKRNELLDAFELDKK